MKKYGSTVLIAALLSFAAQPASALGTYSEGWAVIKLTKFESRGIIFDSFEGYAEVKSFDKSEQCDKSKDECYTPTTSTLEFSVRDDNAAVANMMRKAVGSEMLIHFRQHRIEPIALSTDFEVLEAFGQEGSAPADMQKPLRVPKTGSRNFSVFGRFLRIEYQGTAVGTYEGLYQDQKSGKVYPFSITNEEMAQLAIKTMKYSQNFYFGISVAIVTGVRKSDHDLFEINYKEPADSVPVTPPAQ